MRGNCRDSQSPGFMVDALLVSDLGLLVIRGFIDTYPTV